MTPADHPPAPGPFGLVRRSWPLLTPAQRRGGVALLGLMVGGMLLEMIGLGMLLPTLAIVANDDPAAIGPTAERMIRALGNPSREHLLLGSLAAMLAVSLVKAAFLVFVGWQQASYMAEVTSDLARRLFATYMHQPWTFHLQRNSAELCRNVNTEVGLVGNAFSSWLNWCADAFVLVGIAGVLLVVQPVGTLIAGAALGVSTLAFEKLTRPVITRWATARQVHESQKLQHLMQGLHGIKDVKILGREFDFMRRFDDHNVAVSHAIQRQALANQLPRLWYELVSVVGLCTLAATLLLIGTPSTIFLPTLGLFALAAFKLLPSVNRLILNGQTLRFTAPAVRLVAGELASARQDAAIPHRERAAFIRGIEFRNVSFRYPDARVDAVHDLSLDIPRGSAVGLVGESGAGKSTVVDLMLGLLTPTTGRILADGRDVAGDLRGWQNLIGYVPQSIYLTDDTVRRNIAFGLADDEIDDDAVARALEAAQLRQFVDSLPDGLGTIVGERGVRLSGGQRQRIGIARALYHNPEILVLDEATSALDTDTERGVMECVASLHGSKTLIVVAHRLSTVAACDTLYRLERGRLVDAGSYAAVVGDTVGPIRTGAAT